MFTRIGPAPCWLFRQHGDGARSDTLMCIVIESVVKKNNNKSKTAHGDETHCVRRRTCKKKGWQKVSRGRDPSGGPSMGRRATRKTIDGTAALDIFCDDQYQLLLVFFFFACLFFSFVVVV